MKNIEEMFKPFAKRMSDEGLPQIFINSFGYYYEQLVQGNTGLIPEGEIDPVGYVQDMETFPERLVEVGEEALRFTAVVKLNGGLGTSMGLEMAKSLLVVKNDLTFLDVIARQAIRNEVPLILMNSFATNADSLTALAQYTDLDSPVPQSFIQHKELKINQSDFAPVDWPDEPELEWCPPGHGDIYISLLTSGVLKKLLELGYRYAFVSNADNLGAVLDHSLLGYFAENEIPFMMEVADRTEMDSKGGHLAQLKQDGNYILRELAQCPAEDTCSFQNINKHKYFNTNNLWVNLIALKRIMDEQNYQLGLPMIRNQKTVDPRDENSTPVYQLETAMGSAINVFNGSQAVRVPRTRFTPVKKTSDLLAMRSDLFVLTDNYHLIPNNKRALGPINIELDDEYYKFTTDMDQRFPDGVPSLVDCSQLIIMGDFLFEGDVVCRGSVNLINNSDRQEIIKKGSILEG